MEANTAFFEVHSGNYSTFEEAHEKDQQHRAELAQRQQEKQDKARGRLILNRC